MSWELYPIANSGYISQNDDGYNAKNESGKVCTVTFINQGDFSNATIQANGSETVLEPGDTLEFVAPVFGYDTTEYRWAFSNGRGVGTRIDKLAVLIQKYTI